MGNIDQLVSAVNGLIWWNIALSAIVTSISVLVLW